MMKVRITMINSVFTHASVILATNYLSRRKPLTSTFNLPEILLGPYLNTLSHMWRSPIRKLELFKNLMNIK